VFLDDDARLAQVRAGDVILVEGELLSALQTPVRQTSAAEAHFRIRELWLVQRRD
jgi:hypothetical protein